MLAQRLGTHGIEPFESIGQRALCRIMEQGAGQLLQRLGICELLLGLRGFVPMLGGLLFRGLPCGDRLAEPDAECLQDIGRGLQLVLLRLQSCDLGGERLPVQFLEVPVFVELGECIQLGLDGVLLRLQCGDVGAGIGQAFCQLVRLGLECGDLGGIGPAQDITPAVVDAVPVVLFVALARGLDLSGARDGARLAAELLGGDLAGQVEAMRQLPLRPVVEGRIRLDGELAGQ